MAYITKEQVQEKNKKLKELNKKYGVKGIFSGSNSSSLTLTVHEGSLDFVKWYVDSLVKVKDWSMYINPQSLEQTIKDVEKTRNFIVSKYNLSDYLASPCLDYLQDALEIMLEGYYNNSDIMSDYFDCAWHMTIQVGKWDKPYKFKG